MNFNKSNAKTPTIRKTTVRVPIPKSFTPQLSKARQPDPNRFKLSETRSPKSTKATITARVATSGTKRKSATPQPVLFSSDEEDSSDDGSGSDVSRKRIKSSVTSLESNGPRRDLVNAQAFDASVVKYGIIHGATATSGQYAAKYMPPWNETTVDFIKLQYPCQGSREKFELKWPKNEAEDYKPMEDITETIKTICQFYSPEHLSERYFDEETGYGRRFNLAWQRQDIEDFMDIVKDFNSVLKQLVNDGTIRTQLSRISSMHLDWVRRILEQIYVRTVSPKVESLRDYQNGSDNVYGELLPRFASRIFEQTKLNHEQVFVDLGSGVGNVVLQAALEVGCESWGIEMMKNPCDLAELQAKEFPTRTQLWGLSVGTVNLLRGDFTDNQQIGEVLKRADVVLVNNQAFTPSLNDKLRDMFLDLKNGCRVVSLKPFVPEGHKITMRNKNSVVNLFVQTKHEYFSNSVSWTDQSGNYYIATKDPRPLDAFTRQMSGRPV